MLPFSSADFCIDKLPIVRGSIGYITTTSHLSTCNVIKNVKAPKKKGRNFLQGDQQLHDREEESQLRSGTPHKDCDGLSTGAPQSGQVLPEVNSAANVTAVTLLVCARGRPCRCRVGERGAYSHDVAEFDARLDEGARLEVGGGDGAAPAVAGAGGRVRRRGRPPLGRRRVAAEPHQRRATPPPGAHVAARHPAQHPATAPPPRAQKVR
ncbi:Protein of unknown function [Gryllus bimaculatus]|nr:Protein of unknown function [Gryllus bimaculatus]